MFVFVVRPSRSVRSLLRDGVAQLLLIPPSLRVVSAPFAPTLRRAMLLVAAAGIASVAPLIWMLPLTRDPSHSRGVDRRQAWPDRFDPVHLRSPLSTRSAMGAVI